MFASLKNKIREETGSDISKLTSKISTSTSSVQQRLDSLRGRHSRQGSTSSINSLVSLDGVREDISSSDSKTDDEIKRRLSKVEAEWSKKLDEKETEWKCKFEQQQQRIKELESDKDCVVKTTAELREQLTIAEGYKHKLMEYQEDKEQLATFQTQEISKVKHLVLLRDQELAERNAALKDCTQQLDKLRTEVTRLRRQEQLLNDVQDNSNSESTDLRIKLARSISELESIEDQRNKLIEDINKINDTNEELRTKINKSENALSEERSNNIEIQRELNKEISEKNVAFLRNAEISQQMEIIKQDSRYKDNEISELLNKVTQLESSLKELKDFEDRINSENDIRSQVTDLEDQLVEKNKNIKSLQMRLNDMKKALQQELRAPGQNADNFELSNPVAVISPSQSTTKHSHNANCRKDDDDINTKYLKHVIIKFLTSREYEAQHLTRAVATLLKFSPDEEKLLHDTLEWKMSWFGTRPNLGIGQTAKAIPPS